MPIPWLARYVTSLDDQNHHWLGRVHAVDGWSVASNRWGLLAYSDGGCQSWPLGHEDDPSDSQAIQGQRAIRPFLTYSLVPQFRCRLYSLIQWCEFVQWNVCEDCGGMGGDHPEGCVICDFTGRELPGYASRAGMLGSVQIDRNRLAFLLAPELLTPDNDEITISHGVVANPSEVPVMLFVDGSRFRLVLVNLEDQSPSAEPVPTFHPDPVYAELWAARDDDATRLILADWLAERDDPYADALRQPVLQGAVHA